MKIKLSSAVVFSLLSVAASLSHADVTTYTTNDKKITIVANGDCLRLPASEYACNSGDCSSDGNGGLGVLRYGLTTNFGKSTAGVDSIYNTLVANKGTSWGPNMGDYAGDGDNADFLFVCFAGSSSVTITGLETAKRVKTDATVSGGIINGQGYATLPPEGTTIETSKADQYYGILNVNQGWKDGKSVAYNAASMLAFGNKKPMPAVGLTCLPYTKDNYFSGKSTKIANANKLKATTTSSLDGPATGTIVLDCKY